VPQDITHARRLLEDLAKFLKAGKGGDKVFCLLVNEQLVASVCAPKNSHTAGTGVYNVFGLLYTDKVVAWVCPQNCI
jgi:hypothetical protein